MVYFFLVVSFDGFHGIFSDVPFVPWDSRSKRRSKQSQQICWKFFVGVVKHVAQRAYARCHTLWQEVWLVVDSRKNERDIFHYQDSIDILWFLVRCVVTMVGLYFRISVGRGFCVGFWTRFLQEKALREVEAAKSALEVRFGGIWWDPGRSTDAWSGLISNIDSWESLVAMIWHYLQMRISW